MIPASASFHLPGRLPSTVGQLKGSCRGPVVPLGLGRGHAKLMEIGPRAYGVYIYIHTYIYIYLENPTLRKKT